MPWYDPQVCDHRFIPACAGNRLRQLRGQFSRAVHPRVCGEQTSIGRSSSDNSGSSPRVRGTGKLRNYNPQRPWFIPACAGNRAVAHDIPVRLPVHPRVCGEQDVKGLRDCVKYGSSPRVRGTDAVPRIPENWPRFIPACAGNSHQARMNRGEFAVHPRVCGEQSHAASGASRLYGSSPRVRGTGRELRLHADQRRFIPACAGNSSRLMRLSVRNPVHPRVCGEQLEKLSGRFTIAGSSPRVRGTGHRKQQGKPFIRFIPACAGNRSDKASRSQSASVHPRVCGEQMSSPCGVAPASGSSPRVRGTEKPAYDQPKTYRFIPACAGNSRSMSSSVRPAPVHPRVCGEQIGMIPPPSTTHGSSPRVRGTADFSAGETRR